ncbi:MAG: hypothetical protein QOG70_4043 [Solirubrobacteraceae bacterium]|jgi:hypothetical protein|nr:hypothetical protein [Solirubrobacteraceae bacterium]
MPGPRSLLACALLALAASGIGAASAGAHEGPLEITPLFVIPAASGNSFDDAGVAPLAVPAAPDLMAAAHAVAAAHWGVDPCAGAWTESWQHLGATMNAESRWMATDQADPATYSSCSIAYSLDVDWNWPKLCTIVEHELGHLTGHGHVADPTNVMSPYYVQPSPDCAATPQPGATPAPGAAPAPAAASTAAVASAATRKAKRIKAKRRARAARTRKASARR